MRRRLIAVAAVAMLVIAGALAWVEPVSGRRSSIGCAAFLARPLGRRHRPRRRRCGGNLQRLRRGRLCDGHQLDRRHADEDRGDPRRSSPCRCSALRARRCRRARRSRRGGRQVGPGAIAARRPPSRQAPARDRRHRRPARPGRGGAAPVGGRFRTPDAAAQTRSPARSSSIDARSQRDRDQSHLAELDAQLEVARMPARDDEIRAAEAAVTAAQAALTQAEWRLGRRPVSRLGRSRRRHALPAGRDGWRPASRSCSCCRRRT